MPRPGSHAPPRPPPGGDLARPPGPPARPPGDPRGAKEDRRTPAEKAPEQLLAVLGNERRNGRPRPNRQRLEKFLRDTLGVTQAELDKILGDMYQQFSDLGVTKRARRSRIR